MKTRLLNKSLFCTWFALKRYYNTIATRILFSLNDVEYGKGLVSINGRPQLQVSYHAKRISIGKGVVFNNYNDAGWFSRCSIWVRNNASLAIGDNTGFNGVLIYAMNSVTIGNNVKVGGGARIFDTDFHPLDYLKRRDSLEGTKTAPVEIEDDVFIGANSIICKGVHIGARAIVAAGSVVVKDIPADEVWGGNPAHFIRKNNNFV